MNRLLTSVANVAKRNGHNVMMWSDDQLLVNNTRENNINEEAFPDFQLEQKIQYTHHIMTAANRRHMIVVNGDFKTVSLQLQKIAKKANKNTLIVNLLSSESNNANINKEEVISIMNENPYAELYIYSLPEDIIMNKDVKFIVKSSDNTNVDEIKHVFSNENINVEVKK